MESFNPRRAARTAWQVFGSRYALTAPVLGLLAIPAVVSVIILYSGYPQGALWLWWLLTAISWGVPVLVLLAFRFTILPAHERESRPVATLIAFIIAGFLRGIALVPITVSMGVAESTTAWSRVLGGALFVTVLLGMSSLAVGAARSYRVAADALYEVRSELELLRASMNERIRNQRVDMLERALNALAPTMKSLREALSRVRNRGDAESLALRLRDTVDVVVRPLSSSLGREQASFEMPRVTSRGRRRTSEIMQKMPVGQFVLPGTFVLLLLTLTFGSLTTHLQPGEIVITLGLVALTTFMILWLAKFLLRSLEMPFIVGVGVYGFIHIAIGLIGLLLASEGVVHIPRNLTIGYVVLITAVSMALYFYLCIELLRERALTRQQETITELNRTVSSLRQQLNVNSKRIANVLHGPVQSALFASALRLQQSETVDDELVERILGDLDAALTKLAETDLERPDLDLFLEEIRRVWGSATTLDVIEAVPVLAELERDSTATQCVVEVIREGVNNAIKHGEASEIVVEFDRPEAGIVQVCVVNNGRVLTGLSRGGYGTTVLNDMTHDWTIRAVNGKTVLTAKVALDPTTTVEEKKE